MSVANKRIALNVFMLSVIMLNVVAPHSGRAMEQNILISDNHSIGLYWKGIKILNASEVSPQPK